MLLLYLLESFYIKQLLSKFIFGGLLRIVLNMIDFIRSSIIFLFYITSLAILDKIGI